MASPHLPKPRSTPQEPPGVPSSTACTLDRILELRRVRAGELLVNPRSWRRHPEAQRAALREILSRIGYADALLARAAPEGLVLIDGHLRRDLDPEATLPVLVLGVSEEEADVLLASLDPLAGMAVADEEALAALLEAAVVPEELLDELQRRYLQDSRLIGTPDPDEIPERRERPRIRRGELWALGKHRLHCGDATSREDLERVMGGDPAGVVWTDPPYGVSYVGKTADRLRLAGDDGDGLAALLQQAFAAIDAVIAPGAAIYVCHPAGAASVAFGAAFIGAGWRLHQTLVWVKDRMVLGHADYHYRHEPLLYGYKPGPRRRGRGHGGWYGGNDCDSVFEVPRPSASREHPTAKPVELIARCLQNSSRAHARVLDPFAGSGSTLIACEELGRRAYLVEIDPSYCDVILRRWEAFTGEKAVRIDG